MQKLGKIPIDGILGRNGEITINNNGHKLKELALVNKLQITNKYLDIKKSVK
jgi:hypothetical protein